MKPDYTQNQSWLKIMWQNGYIFIFTVFLTMLIFTLYKASDIIDYSGLFWLLGILLIPVTGLFCISYFGFYRFWNDLKNGRSR